MNRRVSETMSLFVSGEEALFSRHDLKPHQYSYDVVSPSAAIGLLCSIFTKCAFDYVIEGIGIIRLGGEKNEVIKERTSDGTAVLRNKRLLTNVSYRIDFRMELNDKSEQRAEDQNINKFVGMLERAVEKGGYKRQPCLGCYPYFAKELRFAEKDDMLANIPLRPLGPMLKGWSNNTLEKDPIFFNPVIQNGYIKVS